LTVHGSGQGREYVVSGSDYTGSIYSWPYPNAHLTVDHGDGFRGLIDLGYMADVHLNGVVATSYSYANDLLTLYQGDTAVDTLHLDTGGRGFTITSWPVASSGSRFVWINTGGMGLSGYRFQIFEHVPTT
jgi:hypothetical protein